MTDTTTQVLIVFFSQLLLVFLKHVNIRQIVARHVVRSMFFTAMIQLCWLIASAIGIKGLLDGNAVVVAFYIFGGVIGNYLNFKYKV